MGNAFPPDKQGWRPDQLQASDRSPRPQRAEKKRCYCYRVVDYAAASPIAAPRATALYPLSQTLVAHSFFPLKRRGELSCGLREIIGGSVLIQKGNRRATDSER